MSVKYEVGMRVRYLTSPDPASLRTGEGIVQRIKIDRGHIYYWINSNWRPQEWIVEVLQWM